MGKKVLKQQHQRIVCVSVRERGCVCVTEGGSKNKQARDAMASSNTMLKSPLERVGLAGKCFYLKVILHYEARKVIREGK